MAAIIDDTKIAADCRHTTVRTHASITKERQRRPKSDINAKNDTRQSTLNNLDTKTVCQQTSHFNQQST